MFFPSGIPISVICVIISTFGIRGCGWSKNGLKKNKTVASMLKTKRIALIILRIYLIPLLDCFIINALNLNNSLQ
jgi:hypothetical protein